MNAGIKGDMAIGRILRVSVTLSKINSWKSVSTPRKWFRTARPGWRIDLIKSWASMPRK
jgi:hypothetical protein